MSFDARALLGAVEPDELEAVVETMVLAAAADGDIGSEERALLVRTLTDLGLGSEPEQLVDRALALRSEHGAEARLADVRRRLPRHDARLAAFGLAVKVTAADGIVRTTEREALLATAESLELGPDEAADLVRGLGRSSQ